MLQSADKQLVQAQNQVKHNIEKKRIYEQNIQNLTKQLCQVHVNSSLRISRIAKSVTQTNLEKFNGDKIKLKTFFAQLNLKLQHNINHFSREEQNTDQNKLSYTILGLEGNAFAQMEPYVSAKNIDFKNINQFVEVLKTCFGKLNPVGMAKHELY